MVRQKALEASKGKPAGLWNTGGSFIGHTHASSPALVMITAKAKAVTGRGIEDHAPPGYPGFDTLRHSSRL